MPPEFDVPIKIAGGTVSLGVIVYVLQRLMTMIKADRPGQAMSDAMAAQIKSLQDQIAINDTRTTELMAQFGIMDRKLHVQQRTITRLEMLVRQYAGLVMEKGITVPDFMQRELDALIDADVDRNQDLNK